MLDSPLAEAPTEPGPGSQRSKLAQTIAAKIAQDILDDGWRVGAWLGNEAALVQRYGVSRWAVREALAMIERDGLVEVRRGRAGGVFVAAPSAKAISTSIRNYLEFARVTVEDIITSRTVLEELATAAREQPCAGRLPRARVFFRSMLLKIKPATSTLVLAAGHFPCLGSTSARRLFCRAFCCTLAANASFAGTSVTPPPPSVA